MSDHRHLLREVAGRRSQSAASVQTLSEHGNPRCGAPPRLVVVVVRVAERAI
jgi:hypothetical protein